MRKTRKNSRRILAGILCLVMMPGMLGVCSGQMRQVEGANHLAAEVQVRNVNINNRGSFAGIENPGQPDSADDKWGGGNGSYVYFGNYVQSDDENAIAEPIRWRVLDKANDALLDDDIENNDSMFLLSDGVLDVVPYNSSSTNNEWEESTLFKWLNYSVANSFFTKAFTLADSYAFQKAKKPAVQNRMIPYHTKKQEYVDSAAITKGNLFVLSAEELNDTQYGFASFGSYWTNDNNTTALKPTAYAFDKFSSYYQTQINNQLNGNCYWWTRSNLTSDMSERIGIIYGNEGLRTCTVKVDDVVGVAPACNLKLSQILFTKAANQMKAMPLQGTKQNGGNQWSLVIKDVPGNQDVTVESVKLEGHKLTVKYTYTGSSANQISMMITDGLENETVLAYGSIVDSSSMPVSGAKTSTTIDLDQILDYSYVSGHQIYIFSEQVNGENAVDYAGELVKADIPGYTVTIDNPQNSHMTRVTASGLEQQSGLTGAMTDVVYIADDGYYFPVDYSVPVTNGIVVTRNNYRQITVSGTPTDNITLSLLAAKKKAAQGVPGNLEGNVLKINGTTTAMEYADSPTAAYWIPCTADSTVVKEGKWYVRYKETDTQQAGAVTEVTVTKEASDDESEAPGHNPTTTGYTVTIGNPYSSHITRLNFTGEEQQSGLGKDKAMTPVTYIADAEYYFPSDYIISSVNGISVIRKNEKVLVISGTPTANTRIILRPASLIQTKLYRVTVVSGTGSGDYGVGQQVTITAANPPAGMQFGGWSVRKGDIQLANSKRTATTFVMPAKDVEVVAEYEQISGQWQPGQSQEENVIQNTPPEITITKNQRETNKLTLMNGLKAVWKGNGIRVYWSGVKSAAGYDIFVRYCDKELQDSDLAMDTQNNFSRSIQITKVNGKKISATKSYIIKVKAYQYINGRKQYITDSDVLHVAGRKCKYTNAAKIKISKKYYVLKKGGTAKLKATIVKQEKSKKLLPKSHGSVLKYWSNNKKIAAVSADGRIKAKKKGKCYIYISALNGIKTKVRVTVK